MSSPDIQTLISRSCLIHLDQAKTTPMNPDDLEHPSKLIKFLVGVRQQNEYFPIGGPWSPSLDGPNPDSDPQVLVRTAVRCVQAQTGIDLSKCIQWYVGSAQIDRPLCPRSSTHDFALSSDHSFIRLALTITIILLSEGPSRVQVADKTYHCF